MLFSMFPVVIPAMPVFVLSFMPLVGSVPAPFAVIGIEASDGQTQYGRADGQVEKTSFHVYSRVGLGGLPCTWSKKPSAFSEHASRFWRDRCCLKKGWIQRFGFPGLPGYQEAKWV